jgi:hypothetical protein
VKLLLIGYFVNIGEQIIPNVLGHMLNMSNTPITLLPLFKVDILIFAGVAFTLIGILKRFNISKEKMLILAIVFSIIGSFVCFVDFNNIFLNYFFGYFIGTILHQCTAFPLFNWFIFPIAGYIWGQYFIRAKDKNEFFKYWPILLIIALIYFTISSNLWGGIESSDVQLYYFLDTLDAIFCILNAHAMIGFCHWIAKYLPDTIIKAFTTLSSNINIIYIAQWFFIPLTIILLAYLAKDLVMHDLLASIIAICILILSTAIALGYKKLKIRS